MDFSDALHLLKGGLYVCRRGWNGRGMRIELWVHPPLGRYLVLRTAPGAWVPWTASQTDLLADDWAEAKADAPTEPGGKAPTVP